jgi:hypothetical protein
MTTKTDPGTNPAPQPPSRRGRGRRLVMYGAGIAAGAAAVTLVASQFLSSSSFAATQTNCQATPSACGFPDATNTGVPAGTTLKTVPGQVSSGTGWSYSAAGQQVNVTGNGAVLSGLSFSGDINITASNVTIKNDLVVTGGSFGIILRHTANVTIQNSTVSGLNLTSGRVDTAISDAYGDSTGMVVKANNISDCRSAVQLTAGLVTGNYLHDPGYIAGDHTNGVIANGGTGQLTVSDNTILDNLGQTDAVTIDTNQVAGPVTNKVIENNLLSGGSYVIYGGTAFGHSTSGIVIQDNRFGQGFYSKSGQFGPAAYFDHTGAGNVWSGNVWDSTGATIPAP